MADLKISTDAALMAAERIRAYNAQMRDDFPSVQDAINQLDNGWDGAVADKAKLRFNEMKSEFCNSRYNVLDNYVRYLLQQVDIGYEQTESVNINLADKFK